MSWGKKIGKWLKNPKLPRITIGGSGGNVDHGNPVDSSPRPAMVERNPNPERPDAFCNVPMRLRNVESYPVIGRCFRIKQKAQIAIQHQAQKHLKPLSVRSNLFILGVLGIGLRI